MTLSSLVKLLVSKLIQSTGLTPQEARLDSELIAVHVLSKPRSFVFSHPEYVVQADQLEAIYQFIDRRCAGVSLAYLFGVAEFWSLPFHVDERVLVPRPETELLVETVLSLSLPPSATLADLGTGSGAIAVALAKERPDWQIYAVDFSSDAVDVAAKNIEELLGYKAETDKRIQLINGCWLNAFKQNSFDLIVSNPPYIAENDIHLQNDGVRFEPTAALTSGEKGLDDIDIIISQACKALKREGYLLLEHGYSQSLEVVELLKRKKFNDVNVLFDVANIARAVIARRG